ncbi:MAG: hypothetical protein JW940_20615 [Polyangiaceae bacterium]|nr:hypothetical protein [Polyangiaceae bacterium]
MDRTGNSLAKLGLLIGLGLVSACIPRREATPAAGPGQSVSAPAALPQGGGLVQASRTTPVPAPGQRTTPVARYGQLSVRGAQLVDAKGEPVVVRGQAFGWHNWWPQYYIHGEEPDQLAQLLRVRQGGRDDFRAATRRQGVGALERRGAERVGPADPRIAAFLLPVVSRPDPSVNPFTMTDASVPNVRLRG